MRGGVIIVSIFILAIIVTGFFLVFGGNEENALTETVTGEEQEIIFVPESREAAKARQIVTLYEKVELEKLQDLRDEGLCTIEFPDETIYSNELGKASFTFEEDLVGEKVKASCDQFERFGISGDELLTLTVASETELSEEIECDYGAVTTPTVYFWFVSSLDLDKDYCVAPLTVLPLEENKGECFSDEIIQKMRDDCEEKGKPHYSIPDANGCDTIYCGWAEAQNLCPPDSLINDAEQQCRDDGNVVKRYTDEEGCEQIRCSTCLDGDEIAAESDSCIESGGSPQEDVDEDTGCFYVYCEAPEEELDEETEEDEETEIDGPPEEGDQDHGEDEIPEGEEDYGTDGDEEEQGPPL